MRKYELRSRPRGGGVTDIVIGYRPIPSRIKLFRRNAPLLRFCSEMENKFAVKASDDLQTGFAVRNRKTTHPFFLLSYIL